MLPPKLTALDLTGPLQVFQMAGDTLGRPYTIEVCALTKRVPVVGNLEFANLIPYRRLKLGPADLLVVAGFQGSPTPVMAELAAHPALFDWIRASWRAGATVCSVCTGAFLLAEAGLLDGCECVVTHWADIELLQKNYPQIIARRESCLRKPAGSS